MRLSGDSGASVSVIASSDSPVDDGSGVTQVEDEIFDTDRYLLLRLGGELRGMRVASSTGVVRYAFGRYEIHPRDQWDVRLPAAFAMGCPPHARCIACPPASGSPCACSLCACAAFALAAGGDRRGECGAA